MQMTPELAFKAGFLLRCAEEGLTLEETHQRVKQALAQAQSGKLSLEKQAFWPALTSLGVMGSNAANLAGRAVPAATGLLSLGTGVAIGAPLVAGAGTGYLAAQLSRNTHRQGLEEAKQDEIIDEYDRLADEAKRRALLKRIQAQTGKRIVPLSPSLG